MKRHTMIEKLTEIGRNERRLKAYTNDQLREAMTREAGALERLAQVKQERAKIAEEEAKIRAVRDARRERRRKAAAAYNSQQLEAERFRLHCINKPLRPISANIAAPDGDSYAIRRMVRELNGRLNQRKSQLRGMSVRSHDGQAVVAEINAVSQMIRELQMEVAK